MCRKFQLDKEDLLVSRMKIVGGARFEVLSSVLI